jgi:TonB family protein
MKLLTGTRIGQSHGELMAAILFSSFFHIIILTAALLIAYTVRSRVYVPPFYNVKLVDLPADLSQVAPVLTPEPAAPPAVKKPAEDTVRTAKLKTAALKAKAAPAKNAMPELKSETKKTAPEQAAAKPPAAVTVAAAGGEKEFPFLPYIAILHDKVERNWKPPPGVKGTVAKVTFTVLRSGRVGETKLTAPSGNFYFDQAAMRAILASSPFPPLPDGFFRDYETFSVDLMERE